jgi:hypothetical protein
VHWSANDRTHGPLMFPPCRLMKRPSNLTVKPRNHAKPAAPAWRRQARLYALVSENVSIEQVEQQPRRHCPPTASRERSPKRPRSFRDSMIEVGFPTVKSQTPRATVRNRGPRVCTVGTTWPQYHMANRRYDLYNRRGWEHGGNRPGVDRQRSTSTAPRAESVGPTARHVGKGRGAWGRSCPAAPRAGNVPQVIGRELTGGAENQRDSPYHAALRNRRQWHNCELWP